MAMHRNDVKKVRFFRDGDANFAGVNVAVTKARYRNFDSLLNDLSRKVPLPFGVRTLHTPGGIHHVYNIEEIEDGRDYVCSTFHTRPIKKLDYVGNSNKRSWRVPKRTGNDPTRQDRSFEAGDKLFHVRNLKPKSITVIAKDDTSNRARLILNRRTAMTYEGVLQTVSDILQLNSGAVKDLFTMEGKKIGGLSDLINGPDMVLATGRSSGSISARSLPSRILKRKNHPKTHSLPASSKRSKKRDGMQQTKFANSFAKISPYKLPQTRPKDKKVKGNPYLFTVKTSDIADAGTENKVAVVVYGSKGKTGELTLGPPSSRTFAPGSKEEFEIDVGNIGSVYKLRVMHDVPDDTEESGWHLDEIIMTSVARKGEELIFKCDQWFSNCEEESESTRELAAIKNGKALATVITYEVSIITGDIVSAGTDSNVYINIFGENGDTGKRWLKKSKNSEVPFERGCVDTFEIEAVSLGRLKKLLIGHDNTGNVPGWFLDKVLVKDTEEDMEYVCNCRKWLDEDEDDGKIERILKVTVPSESMQTTEELWKSNEWKFQDSNEAVLISVASGHPLRIDPSNGEVYADGESEDNSSFIITEGGEDKSYIFAAKASSGIFNLTLDNGTITGKQGKPGLLSEFLIEIQQDNSMLLESVVHKGCYVTVSESGEVIPKSQKCEKQKLFNMHIKGVMRNLGRIKLKPSSRSVGTLIESNGHLYSDGDNHDEGAEFVVHKIDKGVRAFQSATTDTFIRVTSKDIDCRGADQFDEQCQFIVHKDKKSGSIRLESVKMPGVFFGVGDHGRVKHAVDAVDEITCLTVEVLSLGTKEIKNKSAESEENYDYDDGFDDEETNENKTSDRDSNASAASGKDHDYESDNERESSRSSSKKSENHSSSKRSSRDSVGSAQSNRGRADSATAGSRPSSSRNAERPARQSQSPSSRNGKLKANESDSENRQSDTYRTNTPRNSLDGESRSQSISIRDGLSEALSRLSSSGSEIGEVAEKQGRRPSASRSRNSAKNDSNHSGISSNEDATKQEKEESRSVSVSSNNEKSEIKSETPIEKSTEESTAGNEISDEPESRPVDSVSRQSNRASRASRPGSLKRQAHSRASSRASRNDSAVKRDDTYEGLVKDHSRQASRASSKASENVNRSSSRRSATPATKEDQKLEDGEEIESTDKDADKTEGPDRDSSDTEATAQSEEQRKDEEVASSSSDHNADQIKDAKKDSSDTKATTQPEEQRNDEEVASSSSDYHADQTEDATKDSSDTEAAAQPEEQRNDEEVASSNSDHNADQTEDAKKDSSDTEATAQPGEQLNNEEVISSSIKADEDAKSSEGLEDMGNESISEEQGKNDAGNEEHLPEDDHHVNKNDEEDDKIGEKVTEDSAGNLASDINSKSEETSKNKDEERPSSDVGSLKPDANNEVPPGNQELTEENDRPKSKSRNKSLTKQKALSKEDDENAKSRPTSVAANNEKSDVEEEGNIHAADGTTNEKKLEEDISKPEEKQEDVSSNSPEGEQKEENLQTEGTTARDSKENENGESVALSPTPPKTPRDSATPRRSSPYPSRPSSRSPSSQSVHDYVKEAKDLPNEARESEDHEVERKGEGERESDIKEEGPREKDAESDSQAQEEQKALEETEGDENNQEEDGFKRNAAEHSDETTSVKKEGVLVPDAESDRTEEAVANEDDRDKVTESGIEKKDKGIDVEVNADGDAGRTGEENKAKDEIEENNETNGSEKPEEGEDDAPEKDNDSNKDQPEVKKEDVGNRIETKDADESQADNNDQKSTEGAMTNDVFEKKDDVAVSETISRTEDSGSKTEEPNEKFDDNEEDANQNTASSSREEKRVEEAVSSDETNNEGTAEGTNESEEDAGLKANDKAENSESDAKAVKPDSTADTETKENDEEQNVQNSKAAGIKEANDKNEEEADGSTGSDENGENQLPEGDQHNEAVNISENISQGNKSPEQPPKN